MVQWQPNQVVITTPKGTVLVPRRLYAYLEARMLPDDLGLLRDHDWWQHVSECINGIQLSDAAQEREARG
jgi:hypothetical protein